MIRTLFALLYYMYILFRVISIIFDGLASSGITLFAGLTGDLH